MEIVKKLVKQTLFPFLGPKSLLLLMTFFGKKSAYGFPNFNKDLWFKLFAKSKKNIRFVQIGAHDGVKNDPIHPYIRQYGWQGVLVEPIPAIFKELKQNYEGVPKLRFEMVGIADTDGALQFYHLPPEFDDPNWLQQIGTFDRKAIEFNLAVRHDLLPHITSTEIPTVSLKTLFSRNHIEQLDLLLLDVEGLEWVILKQLQDLTIRPQYLFFEWGCMNPRDLDALLQFLQASGYRLYGCGDDILATRDAS
jgi:FkbM family methyltransferase